MAKEENQIGTIMGKKTNENLMLTEHILEIRHGASGSFLDVRGYVADYVRENGLFPHWKIDTNVVNFRDMQDHIKKDGAFAGYKSAGYLAYNPETRNYFSDKAGSFWKKLLDNKHYKIPQITRFGARTKVFIPSTKKFEEINELVFKTFFTQSASDLIGGKEKDVQFIIEIQEGDFAVKICGGPMHAGEAAQHLSFESEEFNSCGFFLDLDFYQTNKLNHAQVQKLLREAMNLTWEKIENIANKLGI